MFVMFSFAVLNASWLKGFICCIWFIQLLVFAWFIQLLIGLLHAACQLAKGLVFAPALFQLFCHAVNGFVLPFVKLVNGLAVVPAPNFLAASWLISHICLAQFD